jgi:hypothetical protein
MTAAEAMQAWRVHAELYGHTPQQTIAFVSDLQDLAERQAGLTAGAVPEFIVSPEVEPGWLGRLFRRRPG